MPAYLTTAAVARLLGLSPETVRREANLGRLPAARTAAGQRLYALPDVLALAERRAAERDARAEARG